MTQRINLIPTTFCEKIKNLIPAFHIAHVKKIIANFSEKLKTSSVREKSTLIHSADHWIARMGSDKQVQKIMQAFDRALNSYRKRPVYFHPINIALLKKWQRANQSEEIFHRFPDLVDFLDRSKLLSQLKVTRDHLILIDGEPAMLVEGQWMKASALTKRFSIVDSAEFDDRFVIDSTGSVYTYLDNGLGLQKYHPYLSIGEKPISRLNDGELSQIQAQAAGFIRPEAIDRPFVMQIVSSTTYRGDSNLSQTLRNPRHAFIRIIAGGDIPDLKVKKGDVWEFGFGWKKQSVFPLTATQGRFRSPDPWEYMPCNTRTVTSIPLSQTEAERVFNYTLTYHRRSVELGREIGFQVAHQNCCVFVREASKQAGIELPTEIRLPALVGRIAPDILKKLGNQIAAWTKAALNGCRICIQKYTPESVSRWTLKTFHRVRKVFQKGMEMLAAFVLIPTRSLLGGMFGAGGEAFDSKQGKIVAPSWKLGNLFDLSSYRYNLPVILQEWQMKQPSTVLFKNPTRLTLLSD